MKPGFLKTETISTFQTPTRLASAASTTYALGWTVTAVELGGQPVLLVSHRGSARGDTVSLLMFSDLGLAIAAAVKYYGRDERESVCAAGRRSVQAAVRLVLL